MSAPTLTTFAERIYDELAPLAYDDENQGYALALFCSGIALMFDQIQGYVEELDDNIAPWGRLMNVDTAPAEVLPWLGQFVGVQVPVGTPEAQARALVKDVGGLRRGTAASIKAAAQQDLTGTKYVIVNERVGGDAYRLSVRTLTGETPDATVTEARIIAQKPAGIVLDYATVTGHDYGTLDGAFGNYTDLDAQWPTYTDLLYNS